MMNDLGKFGDLRQQKGGAFLLARLVSRGGGSVSVRALGIDRAGEIHLARFLQIRRVTPEEMVATARARTLRQAAGRDVLVIQLDMRPPRRTDRLLRKAVSNRDPQRPPSTQNLGTRLEHERTCVNLEGTSPLDRQVATGQIVCYRQRRRQTVPDYCKNLNALGAHERMRTKKYIYHKFEGASE